MNSKRKHYFLMEMLAAVILLLVVCMCSTPAPAADFAWKYSAAEQGKIDGFRIYDGNHKVVTDKIPAKARKATVKEPVGCSSYYCVAYKGKVESDPSVIVAYCPATVVIPPAGGFVIVKPN
jgi:hypothetical protein